MLIFILWLICLLFLIALWATIILSYVSVIPGTPLESFSRLVNSIVNPVLSPVRRVLPAARFGGVSVDLSPMVVSVAVIVVMYLLG